MDEHTVTSLPAEFPGIFAVRVDSSGQEPIVTMLCCPPLAVPTRGSWQNFYLMQPPVVAMHVSTTKADEAITRRLDASGVTVGDVMAVRGNVHVQLAGDPGDSSVDTFVSRRVALNQELAGKAK